MAYDSSTPDPSGFGSPADAIRADYQGALGRAPESDDVINQWLQGSGGDLAKAQQLIYDTPEAKAYSASQTAKGQSVANSAPATPAAPGGMPAGIDPALAAIYQQTGMTPADRGTGFADWQYWQGVGPSQYDRLRADIMGTGTDQPTGTPGSGAWSSSGAADRAAQAQGPIASVAGPVPTQQAKTTPGMPSFSPMPTQGYIPQAPLTGGVDGTGGPNIGLPNPQQVYGPDMANSGGFWQGRTPMDFSSQNVANDPLRSQSTDLIKALIGRLKLGGNGVNFNK